MGLVPCSARDSGRAETAASALATVLGNGRLGPVACNDAVNQVTALRAGLF